MIAAHTKFVWQVAVYDRHEPRIQQNEAMLARITPGIAGASADGTHAAANVLAKEVLLSILNRRANSRETAMTKNEIRDDYCQQLCCSKEDVHLTDLNRELYALKQADNRIRNFITETECCKKPKWFIDLTI